MGWPIQGWPVLWADASRLPGVQRRRVLVLSSSLDGHARVKELGHHGMPHDGVGHHRPARDDESAGMPLARAQARSPRIGDRRGRARPARRRPKWASGPGVKERCARGPSVHETLLLSRSAAFEGHRRHVCTGARRDRPDPLQQRPLAPADRSSMSVRHCFGRLMARTIGNPAWHAKCGKP